jgi:hypothetical protein
MGRAATRRDTIGQPTDQSMVARPHPRTKRDLPDSWGLAASRRKSPD